MLNKILKSVFTADFVAETIQMWGLATGSMAVLTLSVGLAAWAIPGTIAYMVVAVVMALLTIPLVFYMIREKVIVNEIIKSPAFMVAGLVASVFLGFSLPFVFVYYFWVAVRDNVAQHEWKENTFAARRKTGREKFFSFPESVARRTGSEMAASFFHENKR